MRYTLKLTRRLLLTATNDLARTHAFAAERVGFLTCRFMQAGPKTVLVLGHDYHPVADDDYIEDENFGALVGTGAFRMAMQIAYTQKVGVFHIHVHAQNGTPKPSFVDFRETEKFVPDFFHVQPNMPHGAIILSRDSLSGRVWEPKTKRPVNFSVIEVIGAPLFRLTEGVS
jgi:hypothetical protein